MGEAPERQPRVRPNRAALIAIAALGNGVGLAPYLLFVDRLAYLLAVVPASAVVAFFALRREATEATARPALTEWLLGAWSAVGPPAVGSLTGLILYGAFYGGVKLFNAAARQFAFALGGDPSAWGFWSSIWFVAVVAVLGPTDGIRRLARQLYPRESWARSAFFPLLARRRLLAAVAVAGVAALALGFWRLDPTGVALPVLTTLVLFYTSFPLGELGEARAAKSEAEIADAVAAVLRPAGYRVVRAPRTGKPEIDPLLQAVDLLAEGHGRAFAVDVKTAASGLPVEWNEAAAVRTAASVLSDEIVTESGARVPVEPVFLLAGGSVAQSLEAFSQREGVPIVHFANAAEATGDEARLADRLKHAGLVLLPSRSATSS